MIDEFTQQMSGCFTRFEMLMYRRSRIVYQVQRLPSQQSRVFDNCIRHAQGLTAESCANSTNDLLRSLDSINSQCSSIARQFASVGEFDTDKLTRYLAGVLTRETGVAWLPVRYLLRAGSCRRPRVDAYGVIKADAVKTLPGIMDTMTLLDRKYGLPQLSSWVKYRETECEKAGCPKPDYQSIQNMDNIWMFTSNDFISVGANDRFNAFFDLNGITDKPFLHLSVNKNCEKTLREIGKIQGLNCYENYADPELSDSHPRSIALSALSALVSARVEKANEKASTPAQSQTFGG